MEKVVATFREATVDDYDDVMAIGEVYTGADYLPSKYNNFIKMVNCKCYVSLVDGKIVAFVAAYTVDDGGTLLLRAGRVNDQFRGQGVYGTLVKFVRQQFVNIGRVKHEAFAIFSQHFGKNEDRIRSTYTEILHKNFIFRRYRREELQHISCQTDRALKCLQKHDIESVFRSEPTCKHLFPSGRIVVHWIPYRFLMSNVDDIMDQKITMYGSKSADEPNSDVLYTCLSAFTYYRCKLGLLYSLDLFGKDIGEVSDHFQLHVQNMLELENEKNYQLNILFDVKITPAEIDGLLKSIGMPTPVFQSDGKMVLFEKSLS